MRKHTVTQVTKRSVPRNKGCTGYATYPKTDFTENQDHEDYGDDQLSEQVLLATQAFRA